MHVAASSFTAAYARLRHLMVTEGVEVATESWQGRNVRGRPDAVTHELLNVTVEVPLRGVRSLNHWQAEIGPNLPWADEHFEERVSGEPLNPPPSWERWPWAKSAGTFRAGVKFNHTYPERYFPKFAEDGQPDTDFPYIKVPHRGIRGQYGDLNDVVRLLTAQPATRQAYLPVWFPEDTGVGDGGRKPCTLGYHFIRRANRLHCFYPMRSCDLIRHWRDDVYLTVRLMLWIIERCQWNQVRLGSLSMHMTSLHVFANDFLALQNVALTQALS